VIRAESSQVREEALINVRACAMMKVVFRHHHHYNYCYRLKNTYTSPFCCCGRFMLLALHIATATYLSRARVWFSVDLIR